MEETMGLNHLACSGLGVPGFVSSLKLLYSEISQVTNGAPSANQESLNVLFLYPPFLLLMSSLPHTLHTRYD